MKKKVLLIIGAALGTLFNGAKVLANPPSQSDQPTPESRPLQVNLTAETEKAIKTLLSNGSLQLLPTGQIALKSITISDLQNLGLIPQLPTTEKQPNEADLIIIDLQYLESLNDSGSKTVTSF
jgi:hypothetical protein